MLTFFVPDIFTAIAFDSGGVASGAMTASFLLPLALGVCGAAGGNIATEGFGVVAMVAMTPLIAIQILGIVYKIRIKSIEQPIQPQEEITESEEIISVDETPLDGTLTIPIPLEIKDEIIDF